MTMRIELLTQYLNVIRYFVAYLLRFVHVLFINDKLCNTLYHR